MDNSGMPAGPKTYSPPAQTMPVDGGPGSSPTPAPGDVASPGSDEYTMAPNVSGKSNLQPSPNQLGSLPTPDN